MGSLLQRLPATARRHARRRSSKLMPPINVGRHGHRSSHRAEQTDRLHKIFGSVQAVQCTSSDIFLSDFSLLHGICLSVTMALSRSPPPWAGYCWAVLVHYPGHPCGAGVGQ